MRQQSPTSKFVQQPQVTTTTTRMVGSPTIKDQRGDSVNSRMTKITTYRHPKAAITTYRPIVETRTVRLCTDKKCQEHEQLIEQLTQENGKLNQRINELQGEYENVTYKLRTESNTWHIERENMRKIYEEYQSNSQQEKHYIQMELQNYKEQLTELQQKYQNQVSMLSSEIERLNSVIVDKNLQVENWVIKSRDLEIDYEDNKILKTKQQDLCSQIILLRAELERQSEIIINYENQITCQKDQYLSIIEQKDSYLQQYKQNNQVLEIKLEEQMTAMQSQFKEIDNLQIRLDTMTQQVEYYKNECSEYLNQKCVIQTQYEQAQDEINKLSDQIYQMKLSQQDQNKEIEKLKLEYNTQIQANLDQYEQELQSIKQRFEQNKQQGKSELIIQLEKYDNLQTNYHELDVKLLNLQQQYQQLKNQYEDKCDELQRTQQQLDQYKKDYLQQCEEVHKFKSLFEVLQNKTNYLSTRNQELESSLQLSREQIDNFQNQNKFLQQELMNTNSRQAEESLSLRSQIEDFEVAHANVSNQNKDLQTQINEYLKEINILKSAHSQIEAELSRKLSSQEEKLYILTQELPKLEDQLSLKNKTINELNSEIQLLQNKLKEQESQWKEESQNYLEIQNELKQQILELQSLHQQKVDSLKKDNNELKTLVQEQGSIVDNLTQSNDKLSKQLDYKIAKEEELNQKVHYLTNQLSALQQKETELEFANEEAQKEIENLRSSLRDKQMLEQDWRFKFEKCNEEVKIKQLQIEELRKQLLEMENIQQNETVQIEEKFSYYRNEVETWKQKFITLNRDYHRTQEDLMMLQAEFDAFKQRKSEYKQVKDSVCFEVRKSSLYVSKENNEVRSSSTIRPLKEVNI